MTRKACTIVITSTLFLLNGCTSILKTYDGPGKEEAEIALLLRDSSDATIVTLDGGSVPRGRNGYFIEVLPGLHTVDVAREVLHRIDETVHPATATFTAQPGRVYYPRTHVTAEADSKGSGNVTHIDHHSSPSGSYPRHKRIKKKQLRAPYVRQRSETFNVAVVEATQEDQNRSHARSSFFRQVMQNYRAARRSKRYFQFDEMNKSGYRPDSDGE